MPGKREREIIKLWQLWFDRYKSDDVILGDIKPCEKESFRKDQNNWESRKYDMVRRTVEYLTDFVVFDIVIKYCAILLLKQNHL